MNESKVPQESAGTVVKALMCCATNQNEGGACGNCPMEGKFGRFECSEMLCKLAAETITNLLNATENTAQREMNELIRLAGECNTALERGLNGVSGEMFSQMQTHQQKLMELGRASAINAEPVSESGWRVLDVTVDGTVIFGSGREGY